MRQMTEADLYDYTQMCSGKYGPQWTAIRKLVQEVRNLRRDLLATKPAGTIHNNDLDAVLLTSSDLHRAITGLVSKLRPIPLGADQYADVEPRPMVPVPTSSNVLRKLFSIKDTATAMGVSRATAYQLVQTGRLASVRIGSRVLVRLEAIDDFLGSATTYRDGHRY